MANLLLLPTFARADKARKDFPDAQLTVLLVRGWNSSALPDASQKTNPNGPDSDSRGESMDVEIEFQLFVEQLQRTGVL
ncbi:flagellar basal body rod protein FlgB [Anopheles sinensis]|uniref:Flagellar basal body rod protein FlgB n=1 Tax=Anopheles sinensis TaxID=74873 RepID=A0A084W0B2_ANOSI|nr:flagellar basal body rod protein FlgB [Anopheles sinensis]